MLFFITRDGDSIRIKDRAKAAGVPRLIRQRIAVSRLVAAVAHSAFWRQQQQQQQQQMQLKSSSVDVSIWTCVVTRRRVRFMLLFS